MRCRWSLDLRWGVRGPGRSRGVLFPHYGSRGERKEEQGPSQTAEIES